jgi:hypothetical protein
MVRPFACAFQGEEPWFVPSCPGDVYGTVIDGPYIREGAPLWLVAPIEHPLDVMEANGRSRVRQIRYRAQ